jgi:subtilisin-like proprotein convertase family protein
MQHSFVGDLTIKLVSPANTVVTLMSRPGVLEAADDGSGGPGDESNLTSVSPITWVTGAATSAENMGISIGDAQAVCQADGICSFNPNAGAATPGNLASFNGQAFAGTWKFCAGDSGFADLGSIDRVTLTISR